MKKKKREETQSKIREKINQIYEENELANLVSNKNRARSITVGTAFGGAVEISMRGDYHDLWVIMQPVEAVELIEQLASGIGLQVAMRPKQDFAAWRGWNIDAEDRYWAGAAPWQIEDTSHRHKKLLNQERNDEKLLSESDDKKTKKEIEIQEKIRESISKEVAENLNKFREDLGMDSEELLEMVKEEMENYINDTSEEYDE
jgi:hypothetical protein